ncbi:MAG: hypothetical protein GY816_04500 [Cytophagales bacterium]|nr:hypothetical protein [Cytophagales bacterium]
MKSIITLFLFVAATIVIAQEQDSTKAPQDTVSTKVVKAPVVQDTIPEIQGTTTPKIIYYQTIPEEEKVKKRKDIRTLSGSMSHSGGFGALSFRSTTFSGETMVLAGLRGGWIINRTLGFGLEAHGIIPTAKYSDIDTAGDVIALGGYGGMFLELIFFSNEVVHITVPVSGGAGWMGYSYDFDGNNPQTSGDDLVDEDVFWYVEPGVGLEVNLSRSFRLAFGASKRLTQDLDLINTDESAFDRTSYFITLKVGGF